LRSIGERDSLVVVVVVVVVEGDVAQLTRPQLRTRIAIQNSGLSFFIWKRLSNGYASAFATGESDFRDLNRRIIGTHKFHFWYSRQRCSEERISFSANFDNSIWNFITAKASQVDEINPPR
jgi:hypothetical protein